MSQQEGELPPLTDAQRKRVIREIGGHFINHVAVQPDGTIDVYTLGTHDAPFCRFKRRGGGWRWVGAYFIEEE